MTKARQTDAEGARNHLPQLLEDAARGRATVITHRGRPVAALVPLKAYHASKQRSLLDLEGSGRGLWGRVSSETLTKFRDDWNR